MDKEDISRAICEIKCVCLLSNDECVGELCVSMAENIIKTLKQTPQNPEYRFKHLSEEPIG